MEPSSTRWWAVGCFALVTVLYAVGILLTRIAGQQDVLLEVATLAFFPFALVGVLIAVKRPGNSIAWLCLGVGLAWGLEQALWGVALYGLAHPGNISSPQTWAAFGNPFWVPGVFLGLTIILLVFPDGRLPSPRWRWFLRTSLVALVVVFLGTFVQPVTSGYGRPKLDNPLAPGGAFGGWALSVWEAGGIFILLFACVAGSVVSVVVRFRRSAALERKQLKWLAFAGVLCAAAFLPAILLADLFGEAVPLMASLTLAVLPVSIGIAVTRYRLYEIDRIVSRTVTYLLVVGILALVYAGAVGLITMAVPTESAVAVAGSTLAAAALFNPLRRRVQSWIDKRFHRARYDAERVIEGFTGNLRDGVNPNEVADGWRDIVAETMEPQGIAVWYRDS